MDGEGCAGKGEDAAELVLGCHFQVPLVFLSRIARSLD
jgi:hypothetical protein